MSRYARVVVSYRYTRSIATSLFGIVLARTGKMPRRRFIRRAAAAVPLMGRADAGVLMINMPLDII